MKMMRLKRSESLSQIRELMGIIIYKSSILALIRGNFKLYVSVFSRGTHHSLEYLICFVLCLWQVFTFKWSLELFSQAKKFSLRFFCC